MSDAEKAAELMKNSVEKMGDSPNKIPVESKSETCERTSVNSHTMKTGKAFSWFLLPIPKTKHKESVAKNI